VRVEERLKELKGRRREMVRAYEEAQLGRFQDELYAELQQLDERIARLEKELEECRISD
jgi:transposase